MRTLLSHLVLATGLVALLAGPAAAKDKLTVYTYESFTADWGPGPAVKKEFEAECGCSVDFVSVADGVALLNRVKLEGAATKADIVLGLDTNLTAEAKATGLFAPHALPPDHALLPGSGHNLRSNRAWVMQRLLALTGGVWLGPPILVRHRP